MQYTTYPIRGVGRVTVEIKAVLEALRHFIAVNANEQEVISVNFENTSWRIRDGEWRDACPWGDDNGIVYGEYFSKRLPTEEEIEIEACLGKLEKYFQTYI